jgi:hypothetical protein
MSFMVIIKQIKVALKQRRRMFSASKTTGVLLIFSRVDDNGKPDMHYRNDSQKSDE